jgi:adenylyltransferase/sulfurtransferase
LSPVVGVIGSIQAVETIKLLLNIGAPSIGKLLIYDAKNMHWSEIKFKKDPKCRVCA